MKKNTICAFLAIFFIFTLVINSSADEIIIDNNSPNFSTNGPWYTSTLVPGYYGNNYVWAYSGRGEDTAEWVFQLPSDGSYQVFAWWSAPYWTRSSDAPYTVYHANGSTRVEMDQTTNGGQWNELGIFYFTAGEARVVLSNDTSGVPVADAVRIVYVTGGETLSAAFSADPLSGYDPLEVSFTDQSTGQVETWFWDFGDGGTSTEKNPSYVYLNPGIYTVSLTVTGAGQESTETKTDYITVNSFSDNVAYQFIWPIEEEDFFIFQGFGNERMEMSGYHAGTDFGVYEFNIPIRCIANGWVESIDTGFGYSIMIRHLLPDGETVYSWYNHMAYSVAGQFDIGQFVPIGTIIGTVGETGWTPSGLHIHLAIKKNTYYDDGYEYDLSGHYNPYEFILSRLSYNPNPPAQCSDGTSIDDCSAEKPLHCIEGGILVENSLVCGCDYGVPQTDGTCSKTEDGIIIDNDDPGFQTNGYWELTTEVMGFYGLDYLLGYPGEGYATATWTPDIPETGYYKVYGWWRDRFSAEPSYRATNAPIIINHAQKQSQVTVDFSDYYKGWKYLGTFLFEEGTNNSVVLSNTPEGEVVADAFRFVWDSPSLDVTADFTGSPTEGTAPLTVQFTDASTGDISTWLWDFGDGNSSSEQSPSHQYTAEGTYSVSLTVTGPGGSDTEAKPSYIVVSAAPVAPVADFTGSPTEGTAPLTVQFTDASTGDISTWLWDFGDGNSSSEQSPSHQYTAEGTYSVSLTVTGPGGSDTRQRQDYISVTGVVNNAPVADDQSVSTIENTTIAITLTASDADGDPLTFTIDSLPSNGTLGGTPPEVSYTPDSGYVGSDSFTFKANDGLADSNVATVTITVTPDSAYDEIIDNTSSNFSTSGTWYVSSLVPGYYGSNYMWTYGSRGEDTAEWTFQLPSGGSYQVFAWWSAPYSTRSPDAPYTIYHANGSTTVDVNQNANGSQWNELGTFVFTAGEARVVLTNNASGNPVADAVRIVEVTSPIANFEATPVYGEAPLSVSFINQSIGNIDSFIWDFGDGETSTEENPVHQYSSPGIYTVTLEVSGTDGSDTETKTDFITVSEPGAYDEIIDNTSSNFSTSGTWYVSSLVPGYYGSNYMWTYGSSGEDTAEWVFQLPSGGTYQVFAWWSAPYSTRSPDAPYTIYHANGSTTVDVNQNANGSQWNELGTFIFTAGEARVVLTNNASGNPVADAVRIIRVSD